MVKLTSNMIAQGAIAAYIIASAYVFVNSGLASGLIFMVVGAIVLYYLLKDYYVHKMWMKN